MLNFDDILKGYPARVQGFKRNILTEYLQYRILDIIYASKYADKLVFLGGTAIRIVRQGVRFSEDLDFDNRGLVESDFEEISAIIKRELVMDGYDVEIKNVYKGAYHCYIRFPGLLFDKGLSGHVQQRILIQIDAEPQNYSYAPEKFLINRFGIFRYINTVSAALLLAQKIWACLNRPREKGRDFFDVVFLMPTTDPDYRYLKEKAGVGTKEEMVRALKTRIARLNLKSLAKDVEPFLMDASQAERVSLFHDWLETL